LPQRNENHSQLDEVRERRRNQGGLSVFGYLRGDERPGIRPMPTSVVFDMLKPFLWMALAAFLVGFCSYFLFNEPSQFAAEQAEPWSASVSGPSSDEWNVVKHI
jgi:hypothetical protein